MNYYSTRTNEKVSASLAIINAFDKEGGLYLPEKLPKLKLDELLNKSYQDIGYEVLKDFFDEFNQVELKDAIYAAYNKSNFEDDEISRIHSIDNYGYLELFHGNTFAFKDMALALYPYLIRLAFKKQGINKKAYILTATSGDTGKAAMESVKDADDIRMSVLYPKDGVSKIQQEQMMKQQGDNIDVIAIKGNFDDAQNYVKEVFNNKEINDQFSKLGYHLISANSINIARLLPQIIYYVDAYLKLVKSAKVSMGDFINISVPTGNFGNILAGYFAKEMGVPINKIICASNENNILYDFFKTGIYDIRNRDLIKTVAPSMDILISSNLERFLAYKLGVAKAKELLKELKENKSFSIDESARRVLGESIEGAYLKDEEIKKIISKEYLDNNYLIDPHTAIAKHALDLHKDNNYGLIIATASPYKFLEVILDSFEKNDKIREHIISKIPKKIKDLDKHERRFEVSMSINDVTWYLLSRLNSEVRKDFEIVVPATTANIGSGFDTVGIAMNLKNKFIFKFKDGFNIEGTDLRFSDKTNLVYSTYASIMKKYGAEVEPNFNLEIVSNIPISRGLGSSSTCIIAGVMIASIVGNLNLTIDDILFEAATIEGHPDNVVPALLGSMASAALDDEKVYYNKISVAKELDFYAIIGKEELSTKKARDALPNSLTYKEAIFNISRVSIMLNAFENAVIEHLPIVTDDRIHQEYRLKLICNIDEIRKVIDTEKFITHWVSGAGTTVMLLGEKRRRKNIEKRLEDFNLDIKRINISNDGMNFYIM